MSRPKRTAFEWTPKRQQAAQLLAEDDLGDREIAKAVGIVRATLSQWKLVPEFTARVAEIQKTLGDMSLRYLIAQRRRRLKALDDRWQKMLKVIEERAADPKMKKAPGGKTGLLVLQYKGLGSGNNFEIKEEYAVDNGLLRELLAHEKQAAQETGQWTEKHEHGGKDGAPLPIIGFEIVYPVTPDATRTEPTNP